MADNSNVDLSALDKVRRMFGMPTLIEQMQAERLAAQGLQPAAIPVERTAASALTQRQNTLDFAQEELRRQAEISRRNAGGQ